MSHEMESVDAYMLMFDGVLIANLLEVTLRGYAVLTGLMPASFDILSTGKVQSVFASTYHKSSVVTCRQDSSCLPTHLTLSCHVILF